MTTDIQMTEIPPTPDRPGAYFDDNLHCQQQHFELCNLILSPCDSTEVWAIHPWKFESIFSDYWELQSFQKMLAATQ